MASLQKAFERLDLKDNLSIVYTARKGVKPTVFYSFAKATGMAEKKLAGLLHVHPRTIQNYHEKHQSLAPVESEHLLKLIALFMKGEALFGDVHEFSSWLEKAPWNSTTQFSAELLITPGGIDLVAAELDRLSEGYPV